MRRVPMLALAAAGPATAQVPEAQPEFTTVYDAKCMAEVLHQCMHAPPVPYRHLQGGEPNDANLCSTDSFSFGPLYTGHRAFCGTPTTSNAQSFTVNLPAMAQCKAWLELRPPAQCERRMFTERGWRDALRADQNSLVARFEQLCIVAGGTTEACKKASAPWLPGQTLPITPAPAASAASTSTP